MTFSPCGSHSCHVLAPCRPCLWVTVFPALGKIGGSLEFSLLRHLFFILLLQLSTWTSDSFLVMGPSEPIVAMLGADTVLPCRVSPAMSVENMELRWFRSQFSEAVYVYQGGVEQEEEQLVDFRGRTELIKDYMADGRVAVRIHNLQVSDNGMYKCFFKKDREYEEAILELKVIGLGSGPRILIMGLEDKGIKLKCTGKGWFPQPEVQWEDTRGQKIPSLSEVGTQDDDGLFQIDATLIVRDSSKGKVSCSMKNPFFGQEQVETISIPEPFFPRASPWKAAFAVTFSILVICLTAAVYLAWKEKQEKKRVWEAKEEKDNERKVRESLEKELVYRKELYKQDWRKAQLYADWRKEQFEIAAVSLDPDTAHPNLTISKDRRQVSSAESIPQNCDAPAPQEQGGLESTCSVLGQTSFSTGKHYWEVKVDTGTEVGAATRWALGVCSSTAKREGWFKECPEKEFWVVACEKGRVLALSSHPEPLSPRQQPQTIGVFLDRDAGDVSFYNMADGSHVYSFAGLSFCGAIHPYFSLRGVGTSMTICSASDDTENCPDSFLKTPMTHLPSCTPDISQEAKSLLSREEVECQALPHSAAFVQSPHRCALRERLTYTVDRSVSVDMNLAFSKEQDAGREMEN